MARSSSRASRVARSAPLALALALGAVARAPAAPAIAPPIAAEPAPILPAPGVTAGRAPAPAPMPSRWVGATAAVRLAPATPGAVRFTVMVPASRLSPADSVTGYRSLALEGYELQGSPGEPALPTRVVAVAVPPEGAVTLRAVASEIARSDDVLLAPAPSRDAGGHLFAVAHEAAYAAAGEATPAAARLVDVTWLRNQRIARIAIEPAAYQPAARRLAVAGRVDVELQVQPAAAAAPAETSDPFEGVYRMTLANYEQGRAWRRPAGFRPDAPPVGARRVPASALRAVSSPPGRSLFVGHGWVKIAVRHTGFYVLDYSTLRGFAAFNDITAPWDSLRLIAWPGRPLLPETTYCDTCDYQQVAIGMLRDVAPGDTTISDGLFSSNDDAFYFFAQGPDGWANNYDASAPDSEWIQNPDENDNFYFLGVGTRDAPFLNQPPLRIGVDAAGTARSVPPTLAGAVDRPTLPGRLHREEDHDYEPNAAATRPRSQKWEKWFWRVLTPGTSFNDRFDVPDADTTQPAHFHFTIWGLTDNQAFTFPCSYDVDETDHAVDVALNASGPGGVTFPRRSWNGYTDFAGGVQDFDTSGVLLHASGNQLTVSVPQLPTPVNCPGKVDQSGVAFYQLAYTRELVPVRDSIDFRTAPESGTFRYAVGPFTDPEPPYLFDVTDPLHPVLLRDFAYDPAPGGFTLSFADTQTVEHRYATTPAARLRSRSALLPSANVADASFTSLRDLRSPSLGADYLTIFYDSFTLAAGELTAWRRQHLPIAGGSAPFLADSVAVTGIFDQFSGGRADPTAIRNFLRVTYTTWSRTPAFVTFLGDASYDFRNIKGLARAGEASSLVPSYENSFDSFPIVLAQYATDDWLLNVNDLRNVVPDFFGGRLPADDPQAALDVVRQKVEVYDSSAPLGEYRNEVMLVADDDTQGNICDRLGWTHVSQTADLDSTTTAPHMDRVRIYLHKYPTGPAVTKPLAREDLQKHLNEGVTLFNYVGHGSPFKIADEGVLLVSDAGTLSNGTRMPLFVAASCDVGRFDDPVTSSLGEQLVMTSPGGCIGVISSTGLAISGENALFNRYVYQGLFERDTLAVPGLSLAGSGQYHVPISAAVLASKYIAPSVNNAKYQLLGDAATVLALPRLWVDISVTDENGAPVTEVQRGHTLIAHGRVLDRPGGAPVAVSGVANLLVEDSTPLVSPAPYANLVIPCGTRFDTQTFYFDDAGPMYHGEVSVVNGAFDSKFVVPLDATTGAYGRVRAYLQGRPPGAAADVDGVGSLRTQISPGAAPAGDDQGPRIQLSFVGGATNVRPNAVLEINLFDPSGIMTTGHVPLNSIIVTVDDNSNTRSDVTSTFRYAADSYQSGTASFTLPGLAPGPHTIKVQAADNLATGIDAVKHRSSATLSFSVVDTPSLSILRTYLFPDPARSGGPGSGGVFVVDAPGDSVNTLLRIYTISGKLVRTLRRMAGLGQVQLAWDGRDEEGDRLAQGTYLYKVYVYGREADGKSSSSQNATALGRFVILSP